jgi:hypothetical protein
MNIYEKLMNARIRLQNTKLEKTGHNKFAGYYYFELGDFLPTVQTIFQEIGLCGVVSFGEELATLTIYDGAENSNPIVITSPMKEANLKGCHPIQNLGAVETYTRRYLWVAALEIVEHDILDATTGSEKAPKGVNTSNSQKQNDVEQMGNFDANGKVKPGNVTPSIAVQEWDKLDEEAKQFLTDIAVDIIAAIDATDIETAHGLFYKNNLDHDEQVALWSRLDSKKRSTIKAFQDKLMNGTLPQ